MIEKISGRVAYAVLLFGEFLGMTTKEHAIPWEQANDPDLGGYKTDITEEHGAPSFSRDSDFEWSDRTREREPHTYYGIRPYWGP